MRKYYLKNQLKKKNAHFSSSYQVTFLPITHYNYHNDFLYKLQLKIFKSVLFKAQWYYSDVLCYLHFVVRWPPVTNRLQISSDCGPTALLDIWNRTRVQSQVNTNTQTLKMPRQYLISWWGSAKMKKTGNSIF